MMHLAKIEALADSLRKLGFDSDADMVEDLADSSKFDEYETVIDKNDYYPIGFLWNDDSIVVITPNKFYQEYQDGIINDETIKSLVHTGRLKAFKDSIVGELWSPAEEELAEWVEDD